MIHQIGPSWICVNGYDIGYMQLALDLAKKASEEGEVPIGALLVEEGKIIGQGYNQSIALNDPTAHAEILALRNAGQFKKNYRLVNTTLYVTLEPCSMCLGALFHARVKRVIFGAFDPKKSENLIKSEGPKKSDNPLKSGDPKDSENHENHPVTIGSSTQYFNHNHGIEWVGGVLEEACQKILQDFFKERRYALIHGNLG